jgi:uncharacterized protein
MPGDGPDGAGFYRWVGEDLELRVHATPGAKRSEVQGIHGIALKVRLQARAVEGAANAALIELLSSAFQVHRGQCVLVSGQRSREKRLRVQRPPRERAQELLLLWSQGRTSS